MPTTKKRGVLLITNHLRLGCTTNAFRTYEKFLDRKKFAVHSYVLSQHRWSFKDAQKVIEHNNLTILVTNSICYEAGVRYRKALAFLQWCRQRDIRIVDIAHFSTVDTAVDELVDLRLFVSQTCRMAYIYKRGRPLTKHQYLYNPLDISQLNRYQITAQHRNALRKKLGIPPNAWVLGRFGRADVDKWDDMIIRTLPWVREAIPHSYALVQASPYPYCAPVITLPQTTDPQEVAQNMQLCDVLVQTSRIGESFGCAIAEGMLYGKPILVNSTDFRINTPFERDNAQLELVEDQRNGFVCQSAQEAALHIVQLYEDKKLYSRIVHTNTKKTHELFEGKKITKQLEGYLLNEKIKPARTFTMRQYQAAVRREPYGAILALHIASLWERAKRKLRV